MSVMDDLGTSREQRQAAFGGGNFGDRIELKENGVYVHRILAGPSPIRTLFYTTIERDRETGAVEFRKRSIVLNYKSILEPLISTDRQITRQVTGNPSALGKFKPRLQHLFKVIDHSGSPSNRRNSGDPLCISIAAYTKTISECITAREKEETTNELGKGTGFLAYGIMWMWRAKLERYIDKTINAKEEWKKIRYRATPYMGKENDPMRQFMGKIPIEALDSDIQSKFISEEMAKSAFFEEEWNLLLAEHHEKKFDLEKESRASDDQEIIEKLSSQPLCFFALDSESKKEYINPGILHQKAVELGLNSYGPEEVQKFLNSSSDPIEISSGDVEVELLGSGIVEEEIEVDHLPPLKMEVDLNESKEDKAVTEIMGEELF